MRVDRSMTRLRTLVIVAVLSACGDKSSGTTGASGSGDSSESTVASGSGSADESTGASDDTDASGGQSGSESADSTSTATDSTAEGTETAGALGPVELYRGPLGGVLPGWDPEVPRPLVMLGRQGEDWIATLAAIDETGVLFDNVADEIIVWGWDEAPPLLYDGAVTGGAVPEWSFEDPFPVVMLARQAGTTSWAPTLAQIGPDGELDQNLADRIVVWGWPPATTGAPTSRFAGPLDAEAVLPGWDPDAPEPLVMLGRFQGEDIWLTTLARIAPDGTLSDNVTNELRVFGW